jgi:cation transporter-like permease
LVPEAAAVEVGSTGGRVGWASGVKVGKAVGLGISVGGGSVAVGMAIWVAATMVHADDTAVPSTSAGDMVGVPCAPQAANSIIVSANKTGKILFIIFSPFFCLNTNYSFVFIATRSL